MGTLSAGNEDQIAGDHGRGMSERDWDLPDNILLRSELRRQATRSAHAASVRPAVLRPLGSETEACKNPDRQNEAEQLSACRRSQGLTVHHAICFLTPGTHEFSPRIT